VNSIDRNFWRQSTDEVLDALDATKDGISSGEAARRRELFGTNRLIEKKKRHLFLDIGRRMANPLVAILLFASAIAGMTGDLASFVIIVSVVLLSTGMDIVQERRAEATADALKHAIALRALALRDGKQQEIPVEELVPGDIVTVVAGDLIPADGIVLRANAAQVNQAALTGEPYPIEKGLEVEPGEAIGDARNVLLHGSSVIGGTATMLVVATGSRTQFGQIAKSLVDDQPPTAFERGIHHLGILIVRLTVFLVLFVLVTHLALGRPPLESFLFAMALAVGLTPELLPMIVTVSLARGAQRMARKKVIVKRLSAIHDLGQMNVLCTDKTGTLTEAKITMVAHPGVEGVDNDRVAELAAVNATFETGLKSPLDDALMAHAAGHPLDGWHKLDERPFDFERRRVSVLAEAAGNRIEIVKGAPETVLDLCDQAEDKSGEIIPLDEALRVRIRALHDRHAAGGLRMLAVAWKKAAGRTRIDTDDAGGLIFSGLCVFIDPPKASATHAVAGLAAAGVGIKVVSGDAAIVVQHLVEKLNLPVQGLLTGSEIMQLDDTALAARVGRGNRRDMKPKAKSDPGQSCRDQHLERIGLRRPSKGVIGVEDRIEREAMGDELHGLELARRHRPQEHRCGDGIDEPGRDCDIGRPQPLEVQIGLHAVNADIGDRSARRDQILAKFEGRRHAHRFDNGVAAATVR
jgi:Mg2+-importing ATPase